ncbi:hypothetical protein [Rhizobium sp. WYCCWR 11146]|uniref:hypothetical protein n=1 Tax=Rhizobium sp. WYCCWR 11146 TaxID=2749833 RepID=UPI0015E7041C|nr:hypothetical protein [Rhizobium sp. WYCCWR 11146]MBA1343874.1 hypothetical protein [Rhizobium sp. WYCCWR 11146]
MNRRSFLTSVSAHSLLAGYPRGFTAFAEFALGGMLSGAAAAEAPPNRTIKFLQLLERIHDLFDKTSDMIDWGFWALELPYIVNTGVAASPVPGGADDDDLIARAEAIRAASNAIEIPPYESPLPVMQPLSADWDGARNQNSAQVQAFTDACVELIERKEALSLLTTQLAQLSQLLRLLSDVARLFGEVSTMVPNYEWAKAWAFPQISIELYYAPVISSASATVGLRLDDLNRSMGQRRGELRSAAAGLRNALAEEAFKIQAEADRLRLLKEELDQRQTELDAEDDRIRRMRVDLDALDLDINELDGQIVSLQERKARLESDMSSWNGTIREQEREIARLSAEKCPLGATYRTCTQHPGFVSDIRNRIGAATETIGNRQRAIADAGREFWGIPDRLRVLQSQLAAKTNQRDELSALVDMDSARFAADRDQLNLELHDWLKQSWTSRALVHDRANKDDSSRMDELMRRAGA